MKFGFSYVGLIYLVLLFVPNLFWTKNQPRDYEKYVVNEKKALQAFERIGEVCVCGVVMIFSKFNSSLLGVPVAGATLPVIAFLLLGVYGRNPFLIVSVIILGIGHIGIHLNHRKEMEDYYERSN